MDLQTRSHYSVEISPSNAFSQHPDKQRTHPPPTMTPSDLLACAPRIAPSGLGRVRTIKDNALGTLVPPGRDGKHLVIALDGKRGPPVRRLAKDVELVEREAPPPPKLEAACVNCGAVARLKCTKCGAVCWGVGRDAVVQRVRRCWWVGWVAEGGGGGRALAGRERGGSRGVGSACVATRARNPGDCVARVCALASAPWTAGRCTRRCAGSG